MDTFGDQLGPSGIHIGFLFGLPLQRIGTSLSRLGGKSDETIRV